MKLDYGTQLSPLPISLSIGTLKKPKLIDIANIGFDQFSLYQTFLKLTPELFYTKIKGEDGGVEYWESLSEEEQMELTLYGLILEDVQLQNVYVDVFDFFFVEPVIFREGLFVLLTRELENDSDLTTDIIRGVIHDKIFVQVLEIIQQICCIYEEEESINDLKFKNKTAKKLYEKMLKARKEEKKKKKADINFSIPNIISSVSGEHSSLNLENIWDLTLFQLFDTFNRLRSGAMYKIDSTRVSVWGDEKKTFDIALWYKNEYDSSKSLLT